MSKLIGASKKGECFIADTQWLLEYAPIMIRTDQSYSARETARKSAPHLLMGRVELYHARDVLEALADLI